MRVFVAYMWAALLMIPVIIAIEVFIGPRNMWHELAILAAGFMWISSLVIMVIAAFAITLLKKKV